MATHSSVSMSHGSASVSVSMASGQSETNSSDSESPVSSPDSEDNLTITDCGEPVQVQRTESHMVMEVCPQRHGAQSSSVIGAASGIHHTEPYMVKEVVSHVHSSPSNSIHVTPQIHCSQPSTILDSSLMPVGDPLPVSVNHVNSYYEQTNQLLSTPGGQVNQELVLSVDRTLILQRLAEDLAKQNFGHQMVEHGQTGGGNVDMKSDLSDLGGPGLPTPLYTLPAHIEHQSALNSISQNTSNHMEHAEHDPKKDALPRTSGILPSLILSQNKQQEGSQASEESRLLAARQGTILDKIKSVLASNVISGTVPLYSNPKALSSSGQSSDNVIAVHTTPCSGSGGHTSLNTMGQAFSTVSHASVDAPPNIYNATSTQETGPAISTSVIIGSLPSSGVQITSQTGNHVNRPSTSAAGLSDAVVLQSVCGQDGELHASMDLLPSISNYSDAHHIIGSYLVESNQARPLEVKTTIPKAPSDDVVNITNIFPTFQPTHMTNMDTEKSQPSVIELFLGSSDVKGDTKQNGSVCEVVQVINQADVTTANIIYCVECDGSYSTACPKHDTSYKHIVDRPIETRARMSLPSPLSLVTERSTAVVTGVFSTEETPAKSMFGPMLGEMWSSDKAVAVSDQANIWQLFVESKPSFVLDCRSEDNSNWLRFVRRAQTNAEQNLVVFQQGLGLYFVTNRPIQANEELLYWFSKDYSCLLDLPAHPDDFGKCQICQKNFQTKEALARHKTQMHPISKNRKFHCPVCQKPFMSRTKVDLHMSKHTGARPFPCTVCSKHFTDKSNLSKHMKIHNDVKEFACDVCDKIFRQRAHLETHVLIHTGEKRLHCSYCDRKFARQNDFKQHVYLHTKEQQFPCSVCGRTFHRRTNLKKHLLIHSTDRIKLPCGKCTKDFPDKYHLKRHQASCKGKKPPIAQIRSETGAELGLSIAKKRIQKRDNQLNNRTHAKNVT